ncbi:hypothetical protein Plut_0818 [Pelodictyon luteolum DSM 273]|uniref:Uncharacterized protein n=1 Tax=Chlorobium luteolum (strain DSM 273 / BCRC 81028 / 2530) TaxID=319225 RepID=Q3B4P4_CHLL3|nr:hypothetical protein Plut_0818 [Pelodictyon luteolum DSM 273]
MTQLPGQRDSSEPEFQPGECQEGFEGFIIAHSLIRTHVERRWLPSRGFGPDAATGTLPLYLPQDADDGRLVGKRHVGGTLELRMADAACSCTEVGTARPHPQYFHNEPVKVLFGTLPHTRPVELLHDFAVPFPLGLLDLHESRHDLTLTGLISPVLPSDRGGAA